MTVNPFSVSSAVEPRRGVFAEDATLVRRNFLYRVIEVNKPFKARLIYTGWWFRQMVELDGEPCWFQISWLSIRPKFEFELPTWVQVDPAWVDHNHSTARQMNFELQLTRGLRIRRLRIWLAGRLIYDEIN